MHQLAIFCKHIFFVALSAVFFSCGLGILEKPVFGVQDDPSILEVILGPTSDDIDGYIEFDENSGFSAYDIASDTVVVGDVDTETGMFFGSTESLAGVQLGSFAFDTETGDLLHLDLQSGVLSEHNVFASARSAAPFANIGGVVKAVKVAGPAIWNGTKWVAGGVWNGTKWVGGGVWNGTKWVGGGVWNGSKWVYGRVLGPKPLTAKEKIEKAYIDKLMKKGAKNKSVEKIDPTDIHP